MSRQALALSLPVAAPVLLVLWWSGFAGGDPARPAGPVAGDDLTVEDGDPSPAAAPESAGSPEAARAECAEPEPSPPPLEPWAAGFERLHADSDSRELQAALKDVRSRIPWSDIQVAHRARLEKGEFEEVTVSRSRALLGRTPYLSSVHTLSPGRHVVTEIEVEDVPWLREELRYAIWLTERLRREGIRR